MKPKIYSPHRFGGGRVLRLHVVCSEDDKDGGAQNSPGVSDAALRVVESNRIGLSSLCLGRRDARNLIQQLSRIRLYEERPRALMQQELSPVRRHGGRKPARCSVSVIHRRSILERPIADAEE